MHKKHLALLPLLALVVLAPVPSAEGSDTTYLKKANGEVEHWKGNGSGAGYVEVTNLDRVCTTTAQSVVSVGVTAVTVPAASLQGRRSLVVCNSAENVGSPKVKCLIGGTAPVMGAANPGQVITVDGCFPFGLASTETLKCISDTAGTAVTTYECV